MDSIPPIGSVFSFIWEELSIAFQALFGGGKGHDDLATRGLMFAVIGFMFTVCFVIITCSRGRKSAYKYD